jgi:23S rRNA (adenine2503-C2)-methyltransferase
MGMGEPFLNWENVEQSLSDLTNPYLFAFGSRSISVSTAGIPEGIEKFAKAFPQVNLAISLHFAKDGTRSRLMPVNKKYNLEQLREALKKYFAKCNRKVFLEYIMLANVNESQKDADDLIDFIKSIGHKNLLHVNLIKYNPGNIEREILGSEELKSPVGHSIQKFKNYLLENGINATIRKSLGDDIQGACGQLAGK